MGEGEGAREARAGRAGEVFEHRGERADPGFAVRQFGMLGGRVRDAGGVADEQHGRRDPGGQDSGVVARPGGQHRGGYPGRGQHADDPVPQARVETHGRGV